MLEVVDLTCARGHRVLFAELNFRLQSGDALQIRGENGVGKTTLLKTVCGLSAPESGQVRWRGASIGRNRADYWRALAYLGHHNALHDALTAVENIAAMAALWGRDEAGCAAQWRESLRHLGLGEFLDVPCAQLSAGQRRRVALAGIGLRRGGIWILDEPAATLDQAALQLLEHLLNTQIAAGGMVLFTSHQTLNLKHTARQINLHHCDKIPPQ